MAFHKCDIHGNDGSVVCTQIMVNLEETTRDGEPCWYGTFSVSHTVPLAAGKQYRLTLDDSRVGEFCVRRNTFAGGADRAVSFYGIGSLG